MISRRGAAFLATAVVFWGLVAAQAQAPSPFREATPPQSRPVPSPPPTPQPSLSTGQFIGNWYGKWDGIFDTIITVTNVRPDGIADIEYRWQEHRGESFSLSPTKLARIENSTLSFGGVRLTIENGSADKAMGELNARNENGPVHRLSEFIKR